jgi:hypothetical protein
MIAILSPKRIATAAVAVLFSGCISNYQSAPGSGQSLSPAARTVSANALHDGVALVPGHVLTASKSSHENSWIDPSASKAPALLYVSNSGNGTVTVYDYNAGKTPTLVGTLTGFGFPSAPCTDNEGNVFIPDFQDAQTSEYAYGASTPTQVLPDPNKGQPTGCSVDPKTGDLAVINILADDVSRPYGSGNVTIYPDAKGTPTFYNNPDMIFPEFAGYDPNGNLYIDGRDNLTYDIVLLAELPYGKSGYTNLTISGGEPDSPGQVQWGGKYLLIGDMGEGSSGPSSVHQATISGTTVTITNTVLLKGTKQALGYKHGFGPSATFVAPDVTQSEGFVFKFPGGKTLSTFAETDAPFGAVVVTKH